MTIRSYVLAFALALFSSAAYAQGCGGVYTVKRGDSLSHIADRLYKDAYKWTALHQSNIDMIGADPDTILVGQRLYVTCIEGLPQGLESIVTLAPPSTTTARHAGSDIPEDMSQVVLMVAKPAPMRKIKLVTEDHFSPFTDRQMKNGGMLADVVETALTEIVGPDGFEFFWINDPATHLDPLLSENVMDMSLAWAKPDCSADPQNTLCQDYHFSAPAFEYLVLLFSEKSRPVPFNKDEDIVGRTLCRPEGYLTHMLDQNGRNWLKGDRITLKRGALVEDCFDMVLRGEADAVVINEFTGRATLKQMGLKDRIQVGQGKPVSIATLHVVISKSNPNAEVLLRAIDAGLAKIRSSGAYQAVINDHMPRIWASF